MEIIDQKILHDSVRWPLSPLYEVRALPGEIKKEESAAGDIVIANENGIKKIIKQSEYATNSALYTEEGYQPIAVVVVPATHTDDGTARCMSLKWMTIESKTGSDNCFGIRWGGNYACGTHAPSAGFNYRVHGTTTIAQYNSNAIGYAAFPSNCAYWGANGGGTLNVSLDPGAPIVRTTPAISPYDTDGISKNPDWFVEGGVGDYMDGKENTVAIISKVNTAAYTVSATWLTDETIQNTNETFAGEGGNFPAAMACYRYYTIGTAQGDWYLPAAGELVYTFPRNKEIVDGLVLCGIPISNTEGVSFYLDGKAAMYTSTETSNVSDCIMAALGGGNCFSTNKSSIGVYTIAFIKI